MIEQSVLGLQEVDEMQVAAARARTWAGYRGSTASACRLVFA
jgi:hypothetical protein